jgi:hypothetical protein
MLLLIFLDLFKAKRLTVDFVEHAEFIVIAGQTIFHIAGAEEFLIKRPYACDFPLHCYICV